MENDNADLIALRNCELLKQLPEEVFTKIINYSEILTFQKNDRLLTEGENSDDIFIIISGSVDLFKANPKGKVQRNITNLGVGDSIGEMRILKPRPCSLSVAAKEPTRVLRIPISNLRANNFHELPCLLGAILEIMNNRIIKTNSNILERINEKIRKMKQLSFALLIIIVLSLFFLELFFAVFYFTNTDSFCNYQDKLSGTEHYEGKI